MNHGGPAFPLVKDRHPEDYGKVGIMIRDYFAAKAMQAILSRTDGPHPSDDHERISEYSYNMADAMIKAREKEL